MDGILSFDEMNTLGIKRRSMPYDKYFGEMELTGDQVREREDFSSDTEDTLMFIFALMLAYREYGEINEESTQVITQTLITEYSGVVERYAEMDEYLQGYVFDFSTDFVNTTFENPADVWFISEDRAMFDAENEANTVLNYKDYIGAISQGYTRKEWRTFQDNRVRKTHKVLDGKTIPINGLFEVGKALMRFPKDVSMAQSHPEELIGCRCVLKWQK